MSQYGKPGEIYVMYSQTFEGYILMKAHSEPGWDDRFQSWKKFSTEKEALAAAAKLNANPNFAVTNKYKEEEEEVKINTATEASTIANTVNPITCAEQNLMGAMSLWHWIVVIAIIALLFGRGMISSTMEDVAKGLRKLRDINKEET